MVNSQIACFIDPPPQPLPRQVYIANVFRARLFHVGQPQATSTCSKCMESGHSAFQCTNAVKCRTCLKSGHVSSTCPTSFVDELRNTQPGAEKSHVENSHRESPPFDQAATPSSTCHDPSSKPAGSETGAIPKQGIEQESTRTRRPRQVDISEFLRQAKQSTQLMNDDQSQRDDASEIADSEDYDGASAGSDSDDAALSPLSSETPTPPKNPTDNAAKKRKRKNPNARK